MIQSMTGYAALVRETAQGSLFLELKSVNNRFLDLQFRVVEELRSLEPSLRELIAAAAFVPTVRRATKPSRSSQRKRVDSKVKRGQVKATRGRVVE